jgi:hypothetical protein
MKHRIISFILLFVLFNGISTHADAQFFKRLFGGGREKKRSDRGERVYKSDKTTVKPKPAPIVKKRVDPVYPTSVLMYLLHCT